MLAALIFVTAAGLMGQFALYLWRANVLATAALPVSEKMKLAEGAIANSLKNQDFSALATMHEICPDLADIQWRLWPTRAYYRAVESLGRLANGRFAFGRAWAEREMATCVRYVDVVMDQRLKRNHEFLAELRSY